MKALLLMIKKIYLAFIVLILSGCATPSPLEFRPDYLGKSSKRIQAELKSVSVRTAPKNLQTGDVNWFKIENTIGDQFVQTSTGTGIPITKQWESALVDSLNEILIFRDSAARKLSLTVDIQKIEMRGLAAIDFDVDARYRLVDRETGEDAYSKTIRSRGSASSNEAFVGAVRSRLAFVRSIKANIQQFISDIQDNPIN